MAWWWGEGAGLMLSQTISDAEVDVAWWWGEGAGLMLSQTISDV